MKNEEAIKILKTLIPKTCKIVDGRLKGGFDNTDCPEYNAIQTAIKSLKKQIPRKPYEDYNGEIHKDKCPTCHRSLFPNEHHCKCGQVLDWSNEK